MKHVLILALLLPFAAAYAQISGPGSTTTSPGVITTDQAHTPNYLVTSISFTQPRLASTGTLRRASRDSISPAA